MIVGGFFNVTKWLNLLLLNFGRQGALKGSITARKIVWPPHFQN